MAQVPPEWPRVLLVAARILLIPVVAVARVIAWLEEKLSPHRPDASERPPQGDAEAAGDHATAPQAVNVISPPYYQTSHAMALGVVKPPYWNSLQKCLAIV